MKSIRRKAATDQGSVLRLKGCNWLARSVTAVMLRVVHQIYISSGGWGLLGCCYIFPWYIHLADKDLDLEDEEEEEATIRPWTMMQPIQHYRHNLHGWGWMCFNSTPETVLIGWDLIKMEMQINLEFLTLKWTQFVSFILHLAKWLFSCFWFQSHAGALDSNWRKPRSDKGSVSQAYSTEKFN